MSKPNRHFEYHDHWLVLHPTSPVYHICWCRPGTRLVRRKSTHERDLGAAKTRLIEFVDARNRPRGKSPDEVSVHDALNEYVMRTMVGKPSLHMAWATLRLFAEFFDREHVQYVSDLTLDLQDEYVEWRRRSVPKNKPLSNGTIARELSVLKAALRAFWKRGYLSEVPYIRSLPPPPPRDRFLTREEYHRLLAECKEPHLNLYVQLAVHTMQRPAAILDLQIEQINVANNTIDFLPPNTIQSNKRRPVVPITTTIKPLLEKAMAKSKTGHIVEYKGLPVISIKTAFRSACKRAGLKGVSPYTLRHTGATLAAGVGVPLRQLSGMLGHTHTRTTEIYAKHQPEYLKKAKEALEEIF